MNIKHLINEREEFAFRQSVRRQTLANLPGVGE
jgi:hypothetical protein